MGCKDSSKQTQLQSLTVRTWHASSASCRTTPTAWKEPNILTWMIQLKCQTPLAARAPMPLTALRPQCQVGPALTLTPRSLCLSACAPSGTIGAEAKVKSFSKMLVTLSAKTWPSTLETFASSLLGQSAESQVSTPREPTSTTESTFSPSSMMTPMLRPMSWVPMKLDPVSLCQVAQPLLQSSPSLRSRKTLTVRRRIWQTLKPTSWDTIRTPTDPQPTTTQTELSGFMNPQPLSPSPLVTLRTVRFSSWTAQMSLTTKMAASLLTSLAKPKSTYHPSKSMTTNLLAITPEEECSRAHQTHQPTELRSLPPSFSWTVVSRRLDLTSHSHGTKASIMLSLILTRQATQATTALIIWRSEFSRTAATFSTGLTEVLRTSQTEPTGISSTSKRRVTLLAKWGELMPFKVGLLK